MKHSIVFACLLFIGQLLVSCGDTTDPLENTDPVLSAGTISHFHCELSWTQMNHQGYAFDSYTLYRSESPGIASDTTVAERIASFDEIDQHQYADSTLDAGGDYYYALLTRMHESGKDQDSHIWSNECHATANDVITVSISNSYGDSMYVMVHHYGTQEGWLSISGEQHEWVASFDQLTCEAGIRSGDVLQFEYPETVSGSDGPRIVLSEHTFDTGQYPDLETNQYIFDKVETNWNGVWNTTWVDFLGLPLQLTLNDTTVGFTGVTRAGLMGELTDIPSYDGLAYIGTGSSSEPVRFFSPTHKPEKVDTLLDSAISIGLPMLLNKTFTYSGFTYTVTGTTSTSLTADYNGTPITIYDINTSTVFACTIQPNAVGTAAELANLAGLIGAAANRGVLYNPDHWNDPTKYYTAQPDSNSGQFNEYANVLRNNSFDNLCYSFPYADFYGHDSSLHPASGETVTIIILPKN